MQHENRLCRCAQHGSYDFYHRRWRGHDVDLLEPLFAGDLYRIVGRAWFKKDALHGNTGFPKTTDFSGTSGNRLRCASQRSGRHRVAGGRGRRGDPQRRRTRRHFAPSYSGRVRSQSRRRRNVRRWCARRLCTKLCVSFLALFCRHCRLPPAAWRGNLCGRRCVLVRSAWGEIARVAQQALVVAQARIDLQPWCSHHPRSASDELRMLWGERGPGEKNKCSCVCVCVGPYPSGEGQSYGCRMILEMLVLRSVLAELVSSELPDFC